MEMTATFTCNISKVSDFNYSLNWYKLSDDGQPGRLDSRNKKYNIAQLNAQTFTMEILNLERNDSGTYFCGLISFSISATLRESNRANLTVTEKAPEPRLQEEGKEKEEEKKNGYGEIILAVIGGVVLFLVLLSLCYFLINFNRKRQEEKLQDENAPLEEGPPAVTVFTVDYGVLEFRAADTAQRAPHKCFSSDQTEYATVIFPQEKPLAADRDKKTKKQRCRPDRPQPH
ncbi:programmed cell death protein 1 isoform X2 [Rhineura floridana]|nr:programmed cell death protein 1 isoform X2 [Rhineura floridana]XP_061490518.1 programmed cell death protein 1 isoform X2 [Rhineura floridana]XP_061490519.1 programmed cell death protein 1 isoform X2 [Rhineura floridana]